MLVPQPYELELRPYGSCLPEDLRCQDEIIDRLKTHVYDLCK